MGHDKAVVPATSQINISEDDDLDVVWPRIIRACNEDYDWNLDARGPSKVDDVLAAFKPVKKEKSELQAGAITVFKKSLVVIERFGAIAAQGAGMVFGPSQQCFNAVSFVINAVQDYNDAMGNVTILMERVSTFLERLQVFLEQKVENREMLAKSLRASVYRVLQHFLTILGIWNKLMNKKSGKFKLALKVVVFGEDGGVKGAMSKLEQLVLDVTKTQINSIVVTLSAAAQNIEAMEEKLDRIGESVMKTEETVGRIEDVSVKTSVTVSRIEDATEKTVSSLGRMESDGTEKKRLDQIREALLNDLQKRPWKERQGDLWNKHIDGTSKWLLEEHKYFARWVDINEPIDTNPLTLFMDVRDRTIKVLTVKAAEGFGKSYLSSAVITHLESKYSANQRVGIAYYYFQRESGKLPVNTALRSIIYQLASATTSLGREYSQLIQKGLERKPDMERTVELWKQFVKELSKTLDATFFIVLDGIDDAEAESGSPLASIIEETLNAESTQKLKVRMFLTGRPSGLDPVRDFFQSHSKDQPPEIKLVQPGDAPPLNQADVMLYAEQRLKGMDLFKTDSKKVRDLMERAKTALGEGAKGDYVTLDYKLGNLSKCRDFPAAEKILESAKESRKDIIINKVAKLNDTLENDEIREVNELLPWATSAYGDLSIKLCEAILSQLRHQTDSLISLETKLRTLYEDLFTVSQTGAEVSLKNDETADYLREYLEVPDEDETEVALNGLSKPVASLFEKGEIDLVKQVIKTHFRNIFGGAELYEKFDFDVFLDSKLPTRALAADQRPRVRLGNDQESQVAIAKACLIAIIEHTKSDGDSVENISLFSSDDEKIESKDEGLTDNKNGDSVEDKNVDLLFNYAARWFATHLSNVTLDELDAPTQQDITLRLVRALREPDIINAWLDVDEVICDTRYSWVHWTHTSKSMFDWLKDPVVQKGLRSNQTEKDWVVEMTSGDGPPVRILTEVAKQVAKRWVQLKEKVWQDSFLWISDFLTNMDGKEPEGFDDPTISKISVMSDWVKDKLGSVVEDAAWQFCMAETLSYCEHSKEAMRRYQEAMKAAPDNWKYRFGYAKALSQDKQTNEAVEHLKKLIYDNDALVKSDTDAEFKRAYWDDILPFLGRAFADGKQFEDAERTYFSILEKGFTNQEYVDAAKTAAFSLIKVFEEQHKHDETIQLLQKLHERTHEEVELGNWLCAFLHDYAGHDAIHCFMHAAARGGNDHVSTLIGLYRGAIDVARPVSSKFGTFLQLRIQLGRLIWSQGSREAQETALDYWTYNLEMEVPDSLDKTEWSIRSAYMETVATLVAALVDLAKAAGLSTPLNERAESYVKRLEKIVNIDKTENITVWDGANSGIPLARLHYLAGNETVARDLARQHLKAALLDVDFEGGNMWAYWSIVRILKAFDDDVNTLAMYTIPEKPAPGTEHSAEQDDGLLKTESTATEELNGSTPGDGTPLPLPIPVNVEEQFTAGAEQTRPTSDDAAPETPTPTVSGAAAHDGTHEDEPTKSGASEDELKIEPAIARDCDAIDCDCNWRYTGTLFRCKDCYNSQFQPGCYAKLKAGALISVTCSSTHTHLEIPPLDRELWKKTAKDQIWVGGKLMTKREWVNRIKKEWDLMPTPKERFRWAVRRVILYRKGRMTPPVPAPGLTRRKTVPFV